ncbi:MAG: hypothetical protein ACLQVD_06145 [Capsulimonadaceae bacterium]
MAQHWSAVMAAFLASFVEFVEALTLVLAAAAVRGWRPALAGAGVATVVLALLAALLGPQIARWNVPAFHLVLGFLLLLFGLRWLKKAVLRAAGVIKLHDEAAAYDRETRALRERSESTAGFLTAFNGVLVEGIEVIFIVLAVGATGSNLAPAMMGAGAACVAVILLGVVARKPLTRIPENALKFAVGVLISAFGTFWIGEGLRIDWPLGDYSLVALSLTYAIAASLAVAVSRPEGRRR